MKKVRIHVRGHVQGVGFRFTTQYQAKRIGNVGGIVKNEPDGSVLIEANGPEESVVRFIESLKKTNNRAILIDEITIVDDESIPERKDFKIRGY